MRSFSSLRKPSETAEERAVSELAKRQATADRIASRHLARIRDEQFAGVVKGGTFGLAPTFHGTIIYDLVAERLRTERIEINVHRISQTLARDGTVVPDHPLVEVLSVATLDDWPKHLDPSPTRNPDTFAAESNAIGRVGAYTIVQVYPPQPVVEPIILG